MGLGKGYKLKIKTFIFADPANYKENTVMLQSDPIFKVLKRCARGEHHNLESMLIKNLKPKLNSQVSGNGEIALLTTY